MKFPQVPIVVFTLVSLLPILSSCIYADDPLSTKGEKDDTILGEWVSVEKGGTPTHIVLVKNNVGGYKLTQIEPASTGPEKRTDLQSFPTITAKHHYLNIEFPTPKTGVKDPQFPRDYVTRFMIFRYAVKGQQMIAASLSHEKFTEVIDAHKFPGNTNKTTWGSTVLIHQQPAQLLALLDGPQGDRYFEESMTFNKVQPK